MPGRPVKIFRKDPPLDTVNMILKELGFIGLNDLRWFSRDEIRTATIGEWLPELESYYLPCKAKRFIHNWTDSSVLTILRHILHTHGHTLEKGERLYKGEKQTLYQIQPLYSSIDLSGASLQVDFL